MDGSTPLEKPLLLLVDDEPNNLRILAEALRYDYEIAIATSGAAALQFVEKDTLPDLILLDVMMPSIDGYEVCRTLKQHPVWRRIPVIFVSAATDSESEAEGFRIGAVDYIHKPFNRSVVLARIRSHLSVHGMMDRLMNTASRLDASIEHETRGEYDTTTAAAEQFDAQALLLDAVFSHAMEGIMVTDVHGIVRAVNPAFSRITGYEADDVVGRPQDSLSGDLKRSEFTAEVWDRVRKMGQWRGELINRRKSGETYPELRTINSVTGPDGGVSHYISVFSDISTTKKNQSTIDFLTWYDALTSLPNRLLFLDRLDMAVRLCKSNDHASAVLVLDIDRFKEINDSLGLEVGDQVLVAFSERLETLTGPSDTVSRIDGDEFAVLLAPSVAKKTHMANLALDTATRLHEALAQPLTVGDHEFKLSLSIGLTVLPGLSRETAQDVLRNAETAHHKAKQDASSAVVFFSERMGVDAMEQFQLTQALRQAVDNGELRLYLQSQCSTGGDLIGAEALLRWEHPQHGLVSPATFIPLAESIGLIYQLDRWVLDQVLTMVKACQDKLGHVRFAINISADHFARDDFISHLVTCLKQHRLSGHHITLELTESVMIQELRQVVSKMRALHGLGIEVSIDDFGTGYSSLSYLRHLPIQELKIDRSFTRDIDGDHSGRAIVSMIHSMAVELGLRTVVEGVETEAQWQYLKRYPEAVVQGYYLNRPEPAEIWLARNFSLEAQYTA
ncbi:MAG: EAL domain-containing protein [Marinobacter sp.]|uniref:two-component system response regulator n=1 Tax=Marinobacter sp. TaxID=50741 RepID=UPI00299E44B1|nr:EAL domain-containing protein [Marinobacter sp.]MDX1757791.1 EAL domain-containing protein [Marinobacter sp.]